MGNRLVCWATSSALRNAEAIAGFGQSLGALVLKRAIPTNLLAALSAIAKLKQLPKQIITDILCQTPCSGNLHVTEAAGRREMHPRGEIYLGPA
jgi:hypothetical protein